MTDRVDHRCLSAEQAEVVDAPVDAQLLVLAGAGTGKTHTLIERLNHLVERDEVPPGSGVLVLSFTRAAVGEIRDRLRAGDGDAGFIRARTFDSFATRVLNELDQSDAWMNYTHDRRIEAVLGLDLEEFLSDYEHVCVDEIQDLVGPRAELVKKVITEADCGFTLLGDPAQAIYNWQIDDDQQREEGSGALFRWLRETFPELEERTLSDNHRAQTEITEKVRDIWPRLREEDPDWQSIRRDLLDIFSVDAELAHSDGDLRESATDTEKRTAVLCRFNSTALLQSASLRRLGIPHAIQRGASDRCVPAWVAELLGSEEHLVGKSRFVTLHGESNLEGLPPVDRAWRSLRAAAADGPAQIRLSILAQKIARDHLPDDLNEPASAPLVISTIHRSKGREFERVVLLNEMNWHEVPDGHEIAEETRLLFVALSRARDEIWKKEPPFVGEGWFKKNRDRWTQVRGGGSLAAVEIKAVDVDREEPPGSRRVSDTEAVEIQRYLSDEVSVGDPVVLEYIFHTTGGEPCVFYRITHCGQVIGVTSEKFGEDFASMLGAGWRGWMRWPMKISGTHIDTVATTSSGSEAVAAHNAGLGRSGLWLYPRVIGFGILEDWQAGNGKG